MSTSSHALTVHDLRRRWKPQKERLLAACADHPNPVRFHRACSWLSAVEKMGDQPDYDLALVSQWIAFNSLYGRWDPTRQEPVPDKMCWRGFLDRILALDSDGVVADVLQKERQLVMTILEDEYLSGFFWQEPSAKRANQSRKSMYNARTWYVEGNWKMISERLMDRIYLMRCQLVHGAATHSGQLNRSSLNHCTEMLSRLLPSILAVFVDFGADEEWGPMCYPPLSDSRIPLAENGQRDNLRSR